MPYMFDVFDEISDLCSESRFILCLNRFGTDCQELDDIGPDRSMMVNESDGLNSIRLVSSGSSSGLQKMG